MSDTPRNDATRIPGEGRPAAAPGEDAATARDGGGDQGGVVGRDDLEGDIGADVAPDAVGPVSQDAGVDEDVPGYTPEPADPAPQMTRNDMGEQWRDG